jgi:hypothetical protein
MNMASSSSWRTRSREWPGLFAHHCYLLWADPEMNWYLNHIWLINNQIDSVITCIFESLSNTLTKGIETCCIDYVTWFYLWHWSWFAIERKYKYLNECRAKLIHFQGLTAFHCFSTEWHSTIRNLCASFLQSARPSVDSNTYYLTNYVPIFNKIHWNLCHHNLSQFFSFLWSILLNGCYVNLNAKSEHF